MDIVDARFLMALNSLPAFCLYQANIPTTTNFSGTTPNTTGLVTIPSHSFSLRATLPGSQPCPTAGQFVGSFSISPTQTMILVN